MAVNTFVPTTSSRTPTYAPPRGGAQDAQGRAQTTSGYEWLDFGTYVPGAGTTRWKTNPPFHAWEAGSHNMPLTKGTKEIVAANVKRGYIRRAQVNVTDVPSQCRLYFMYNPTMITRQYVNYLDQGALDPFNTVFQSGNMVAPPSILDFSFELFFDRQAEATVPGDKGVLVDMEYFDLVVRNVIPGGGNNVLPDNGVMMVNPRDITVVFSKDMSVQGRPTNAQVVYEKFTHEMTPTRMRIALTMRVVYMGPVRDITSFTTETINVDRTIPYDIPPAPEFNFTFHEIEWPSNNESYERPSLTDAQMEALNPSTAGENAAQKAHDRWQQYGTKYDDSGTYAKRHRLWEWADCSSFVWGGFADPYTTGTQREPGQSLAEKLGWCSFDDGRSGKAHIASTETMKNTFATSTMVERLWGFNLTGGETDGARVLELATTLCKKGDILLRFDHEDKMEPDHVGFFWDKDTALGGLGYRVLHCASKDQDVQITTYSAGSLNQYNYGIRVFGAIGGHIDRAALVEAEASS